MRRTGWIVIASFIGIPAVMFATLWSCWRGGVFDSLPAPGAIQVSVLFRTGNVVECDLTPMQAGHDLVRYERLAPLPTTGGAPTARIRVWQRPIIFGKRAGARLQVKVSLPESGSALGLQQTTDGGPSIIWPPPTLAPPAPAGD